MLQRLFAWANEHPLELAGLLSYALANVLHRLWPMPKNRRGVLAALHSVLDLIVFLGQRGSPDLFTLPGKRSRPPRAKTPATAPPPHGSAAITTLLFLSVALLGLALLNGCATESHSMNVSHSEGTEQGEAHSKGSAQLDTHATDASKIRQAENVVTRRTGGALDLKEYFPDGKLKRELHRAPVETERNARKTAAVQNALTADAKALLDNEAASKTSGRQHTDTAGESGKKSAPAMSCALLGGTGGALLLLALAVVAWRWIKRARSAAAAVKAAVDVVSPLP